MSAIPSCVQVPSSLPQHDGEGSTTAEQAHFGSVGRLSLEEGVARLAPSINEIGKSILSLSQESDDATIEGALKRAAAKMQEIAVWVPDIQTPEGNESAPQQASLAQRTQDIVFSVRRIQEKVLGLSQALEKHRPGTPVLSLMKGIDSPLNQFCTFFDHICPINPEKLPQQTDVDVFDAALTRSRTVSSEEAQQIETLLVGAIGNRDLNRYLGKKEREVQTAEKPSELSYAEICLREVTYTTMKAPSASLQIQKLEDFLFEIHAEEFSASVTSYRRQERHLRNKISALIAEKSASWARSAGDTFAQLERIQELLEPMENSSFSTQQLQRRRIELLEELQEALRQIASLSDVPKRSSSRIHDVFNEVDAAVASLRRLFDTMDQHEDRLRSGRWAPPLALRDFWVLRRYKEIAPILEKLRSKGIVPQDEKVKRLEEESVRARACLERYDAFFRSLPNNMTGDVVVIDDRRERELEGKVSIETFEDAKRLFDMAMERTHDLNAAIWPLRALATQGLSHVAYAFMRRGAPTAFEIIGECETNPIDAEMAMVSSSLRLHLLRLLTDEGKGAVLRHFAGFSEEQIERQLQVFYQECQKRYFDENKSRFASFDNKDPLHAVQAFLSRSLVELPGDAILGRLYRYALEKFSAQMGPKEDPEQGLQEGLKEMEADAAKDPKGANKRLCSELVAEVVRDIHGMMEQRLQQELGVQTMVFRPILPADKKLSSYTIDVLVEELKRSGAYSRVPDSLAIRLCVRLPDPVEILRV